MVSLFGSGTRRHLTAPAVDDTGSSSDDASGADVGSGNGMAAAVELYEEDSVLHVLPASDPIAHDEDDAPHYPMATVRPVPLQSRGSTGRAPNTATLSSLGLPEHLLPPDGGGLAELLALLDLLPSPKLPAYRHGDEILVLTFGPHSTSAEQVATSITTEFAEAGHPVGHATVRVEPWPSARELPASRATSSDATRGRPRSVLLRTSPDCPPSTAYRICRSVPGVRLDLWGVRTADRPAAALAWGAPVAFIDGRPARSELWAAILADRLAGGVH